MAERLGESSMKMGAAESTPAASVSRCQSSMLKNPLRSREESMRASEHSRRSESCSLDISSEKTATGTPASTAALRAMFRASAVLPMLGRAAKMMRSEFCSPEVRLSS